MCLIIILTKQITRKMVRIMWRISYLNLNNDSVEQKGGFVSDKETDDWAREQEDSGKIIALKFLVWSEMFQIFRPVFEYAK